MKSNNFNWQYAIQRGKRVGYSESIVINQLEYIREYVIWQENGYFKGYFFTIACQDMDSVDDYSDHEILTEQHILQNVLVFLQAYGLEIAKLSVFKGSQLI